MREDEMREEKIKKEIEESAENLVIPESLKPEVMMKTLQEMDRQESHKSQEAETSQVAEQPKQERQNSRKFPWHYGTAAAAAVVVLGLFIMKNNMPVPGNNEAAVSAGPEMVAEAVPDVQEGVTELLEDSGDAVKYKAKDYDEVYDRFQLLLKEQEDGYGVAVGSSARSSGAGAAGPGSARPEMAMKEVEINVQASTDTMMAGAVEMDAGVSQETGAPSYSDTNTQVAGIDEGDVVKTDGNYIYVASANHGMIRIIEPNGKEMKAVGEIPDTSTVESARTIQEFYINKDKMTVIRNAYEVTGQEQEDGRIQPYSKVSADIAPDIGYRYFPYRQGKTVTYIETFDLTDRSNPKLSGSVCQDGNYYNSRRNGDYVYVFTRHYSDMYAPREDISKYVPGVNGTTIPADCIYMPEQISGAGYLVISAVDMQDPAEPVQAKAIMADGDQFYVSQDYIYVGATKYDFRANQFNYTELLKLAYRDGRLGFVAHGTVNGYLNNQFSMDEHQGKLRLVSTLSRNNGKMTNSLYVLDEKMKVCGKIEDLAPDEQIYSARFMGDVAYFVTFRNMDPLFSVDLTDPTNPKVLGELKITGFSEYLHPYADNLLLGIGREMDPDSGNFKGLKLSMFDTTDLKNVLEKQKLVEASFEYSVAWYNHKAVLIDATKNLVGFPTENYDYDSREWGASYVVYSYEKATGFKQELNFELDTTGDYSSTRGLYIGDYLYVVENNQIHAFDLKDFSCLAELKY